MEGSAMAWKMFKPPFMMPFRVDLVGFKLDSSVGIY